MTELISVIVATYNRPDALDAVLRGLLCQTDRGFEIVIADDGSGPETAHVVERWAAADALPIVHVWHEDRGFRLAEIRNRAILRGRGTYCIFLDGTASRGLTSSPRIGGSPSRTGSLPATAFSCHARLPNAFSLAASSRRKIIELKGSRLSAVENSFSYRPKSGECGNPRISKCEFVVELNAVPSGPVVCELDLTL